MDVSVWKVPLFLAAGVVAGFLNTVAGGGSFVAFPLLVLFGYPAHVANGTLRITIVLQNLVAVPAYAREGYFFPKQSLFCSLVAVPAAVLGALTAVHLDPESFRLVSAVLVLLVLGTLFVHPDRWTRSDPLARIRWGRAMPSINPRARPCQRARAAPRRVSPTCSRGPVALASGEARHAPERSEPVHREQPVRPLLRARLLPGALAILVLAGCAQPPALAPEAAHVTAAGAGGVSAQGVEVEVVADRWRYDPRDLPERVTPVGRPVPAPNR